MNNQIDYIETGSGYNGDWWAIHRDKRGYGTHYSDKITPASKLRIYRVLSQNVYGWQFNHQIHGPHEELYIEPCGSETFQAVWNFLFGFEDATAERAVFVNHPHRCKCCQGSDVETWIAWIDIGAIQGGGHCNQCDIQWNITMEVETA